jgi:hypothetical protein
MSMVARQGFTVVKTIGFLVIFPKTDSVFCETDMVGVPGGGIWSGFGAGLILSEFSPR